ncbi:energy transducer TonB, partial [Comamonas thiooxydans]
EQGQPEKIEIKQSSGFERLDDAAVNTVRQWKFVPGKRNGVAEPMWHIVPINFVLK